jgi:hypothetical protein
MNFDAAGLHVRVESVALLAEIEDDGISVGVSGGDKRGVLAGSLLGHSIGGRDDNRIGHGENRLAEDGVAFGLVNWAGIDAEL